MNPGADPQSASRFADLAHAGRAETLLPCPDLPSALDFFVGRLGFRIETIYPAEEPKVASLSGHGLNLRLEPCEGDPGVLRLALGSGASFPAPDLIAPNGTRIVFVPEDPPVIVPPLEAGFVFNRAAECAGSGAGRAGMLYRDLVPRRLGGRYIASHISIPEGGPIKDWVHFHKIAFQLIYCCRGWVRVVYEDQGEPFTLYAGDCVLQPPRIRHRVLESSPGLEVVEVGSPALHETLADHDMTLPTAALDPHRDFGGQRFIRHIASEGAWARAGDGFERQPTGLASASNNAVAVSTLRASGGARFQGSAEGADLLFIFVLEGKAVLNFEGLRPIEANDAFVIPPGRGYALMDASPDLRWLEITAPAQEEAAGK